MGCIEGSNSHFLRYNVEILNVLTFGFHLIGATALEPSWAEAWVTLGRAQLNFGEPDSAIESFDKASAIKPDSKEARDDRQTALHLVKRIKQLHSSGVDTNRRRYVVGESKESS
uniref:Uncharacterized protein MANES_18G084200 n=1 Tax=Rhizophora mucronata TaxID=61149 RepID=A0A2P2LF81_RHIMU